MSMQQLNKTMSLRLERKSVSPSLLKSPSSNGSKKGGHHDKKGGHASLKSRLPIPNIDLEDGLVSQLSISDVLHNCVATGGLQWGGDHATRRSPLYHRCYSDSSLTPIWMAYHSVDMKSCGDVSLSRLQHLTSLLNPFTIEEKRPLSDHIRRNTHTVKFLRFRSFVTDNLDKDLINAEQIATNCWEFCKSRFLVVPFVDENESIVPESRVEPVFWLFCIFCRLAEPGFYPPSIDYEEAELLMRKMMACLGVPWSNSDHGTEDTQSTLTEDYESTKLLLVTFQQLLSITAEMVGSDLIRSNAFYRATKWLCLTEFCDVLKVNTMQMKKRGDHWRKRWCVLRGFTFTSYSSQHGLHVKDKIPLNENMNIESLPPTQDRKFHFRIVEKDGDFKIKREEQFIVNSERELREWINIINMSIKLYQTRMTAKYAEIAERRFERHRRRDSLKEVSEKRKDVHHVRSTLQRIRQDRQDLKETVAENYKKRELQLEMLARMDAVYDRLEEIHKKDRDVQKLENDKIMERFAATPAENVAAVCNLLATHDHGVKLSRDVIEQRAILESELERLRNSQSYIKPSICAPTHPHVQHRDADSCYDTRTTSSSEISSDLNEPLTFR